MVTTVSASFGNRDDAENAARALRWEGFLETDMRIVTGAAMSSIDHRMLESASTERAPAAATGVLGGAALGVLIGVAVVLLELEFPGIESVLAVGKIAPILLCAGIGAVAGGLIGGLANYRKGRIDATADSGGREHAALLVVCVDASRADSAERILKHHGGWNVQVHVREWSGAG